MNTDFIYSSLVLATFILPALSYLIYLKKKKTTYLSYMVDIDKSNNLIIHLSNCKKIAKINKSLVQDFFDTYEEAWEYSNILEYQGKDCLCCKPSH